MTERKRLKDYHRFRALVHARQNGLCLVCSKPIDLNATAGTPGAPELDHLIALANGGPDTKDNMILLHRICNGAEGKGTLDLASAKRAHELKQKYPPEWR